jgi:hypothetical protein
LHTDTSRRARPIRTKRISRGFGYDEHLARQPSVTKPAGDAHAALRKHSMRARRLLDIQRRDGASES